jgi:uncharacterized membrane protein
MRKEQRMATIEQDIDIDVPVDVAYAQWTQFESFPDFMKNVKTVRQLDDTRLLWTAEVAGREHTWEAKIVDQQPNRRIAWRASDALMNAGTVTFEPGNAGTKTHVHVEFEYEPQGMVEKAGSAAKLDDAIVRADLGRFKELIEERGTPTGEWSGRIEGGRVTEPDA